MKQINIIYKVGKRGDDNTVIGEELTYIDNGDGKMLEKVSKIIQREKRYANGIDMFGQQTKKPNYELTIQEEDKGDKKSIQIIKTFEDYESANEEVSNLMAKHFYRVEFGCKFY